MRQVSAVQLKKKFQVVYSIKALVQALQTNQSKRQDKQKILAQGARPKNFPCGSERDSRETGY